jgi:UTP--glucose-1-phosphate uridylyltransferase
VGREPFFVLLGDVIVPRNDCLQRLQDVYDRLGGSAIAVTPVDPEMVSRYGVIAGEEVEPGVWRVTDLVEKPCVGEAPSNLAIFGRYLLTAGVMDILPKVQAGRGGEIQLTDALRELLKTEKIFAVVDNDPGFDTGNVRAWIEANVSLALTSSEWGPELRESLTQILSDTADAS